MLNFYKQAILVFFCLILLSMGIAYVCMNRIFLNDEILPKNRSILPWSVTTETDVNDGGTSSIVINDASYILDYTHILGQGFDYPYASLRITLSNNEEDQPWQDFSNYSSVSFNVKCDPHNVLTFLVYTYDSELTQQQGAEVNRIAASFYSCDKEWRNVEIDLTHMEVPDWWLHTHKLDLSNQQYRLDQVTGFVFGASTQSPIDLPSNVKISELRFHGRNWHYVYFLLATLAIVWGAYLFWLVRQHTNSLIADIKEKMQKDRPLVAYQQLSIEPQRDRDKDLILRYMATEYADPEASLELAISKLGISRTRINDILKEELGYTFIPYLNKLRLTEAARLLSEEEGVNVAEIAYSVGYKNVPYFNRVFKSEYGCTPKTFKKVYKRE